MLELPKHGEGLDWIVSQGTSQLLLIPGLQPASIIAAAAGDAEALAYLRFSAQHHVALGSRKHTPFDKVCCAAPGFAFSEQLQKFCKKFKESEKLHQLWEARSNFTVDVTLTAVKNGHLAALQWLQALCHETTAEFREVMIEAAASRGHLGVLRHLRSGPDPIPWPDSILTLAAPHADCLGWLLLQKPSCPVDGNTLNAVAAAGNLPALQHLRLNKYMPLFWWNEDVPSSAASGGHLAVLQWLRYQVPPVPWDAETCQVAAERGDMAMLQWLHSQDPPAPWGPTCSAAAARGGHLSTLQWLHAKGCPWDALATSFAAEAGRLDILQWLRQQRPPCAWTESCSQAAASHPDALHLLKWLLDQEPPCPLGPACSKAAAANSLATLQWLLDLDPPGPLHPECPQQAACRGDLPMLELLSQHGCMPTAQDYYIAAGHGHVHILRWLHQKQVPAPAPSSLPDSLRCHACQAWGELTTPVLLFLGDIGAPLQRKQRKQLVQTRKACCTFYGLVRWCRLAVSDPSKGIHRAFDTLSANASGQSLLVRLSLLPPEILNRIALAAGLRHTLFEESDADDPVYPRQQREKDRVPDTDSEDELQPAGQL